MHWQIIKTSSKHKHPTNFQPLWHNWKRSGLPWKNNDTGKITTTNTKDMTGTGPSPQSNPIWKKTQMTQTKSLHHKQPVIPTRKTPATKNETTRYSRLAPWHKKPRGHTQLTRNTNTDTNNPATTQTQQQYSNQHSVNDNNNTARIPEPATNTFYTQWDDTMQPTKRPNTVRLVLQNFGRWPQWNNNQKNQIIQQFLNDKHINIFLTTENNVAWHHIPAAQCLHK